MTDRIEEPSAFSLKEEFSAAQWKDLLNKTHFPRKLVIRLIMNFLVTEGFKEAAEKFSEESGLQLSETNTANSLDERIKIREAILEGRIFDAKNHVERIHPLLFQNDRHLLFRVHQQHLIELIREKRVEEALDFARNELGSVVEEYHCNLNDLERTLALLAFDNPMASPFGDLMHASHRQKVASEVNAAVLEMDGVEGSIPSLATAMRMLMWAQEHLDKKKVRYAKMSDSAEVIIDEPK